MNSQSYLKDDIERINQVTRRIGWGVWGVAGFVMIYGVVVSVGPLVAHGVPAGVAWMPSLAADVAMSVAIVAGPILARYNIKGGWIGILRWVAAAVTMGLQTAGSWLHDGGPDVPGIVLHSWPPALLFFVGEGAAYFIRKMSAVLTVKRRELAAAEQSDADRRAHLAEVESNVRALTAELETANRKAADLANQLDAVYADRDAERSTGERTSERYEREIGELRVALTATTERLTGERDDALRKLTAHYEDKIGKLKDKHREALAEALTGKGVVSIASARSRHTGKAAQALTGKPYISDETAVQMMLDAHSEPDFEWSLNGVRTLTGVGLDRAKKLIPMWRTAVTGEGEAVNQ